MLNSLPNLPNTCSTAVLNGLPIAIIEMSHLIIYRERIAIGRLRKCLCEVSEAQVQSMRVSEGFYARQDFYARFSWIESFLCEVSEGFERSLQYTAVRMLRLSREVTVSVLKPLSVLNGLTR